MYRYIYLNIMALSLFVSCSSVNSHRQISNSQSIHSYTSSFKVSEDNLYSPDNMMFGVNSITFDAEFAPFYAMLSNEEKQIYREVFEAVISLKPSIKLANTQVANDSFYKIQLAILNDQPELFWFENLGRVQHMVRYEGEAEKRLDSVSYEFRYNELAEQLSENQRILAQEVQNILEQAKRFPNPFEQELFVHDYLIDHLTYETNSEYNQNVYSALIKQHTVCAGFAKAFQLLMRQLGLPAYYMSGYQVDVTKGQRPKPTKNDLHAWNYVVINGQAYNVDVTYDASKEMGADGNSYPLSLYKFFNRTDKEFDSFGYVYNVNTSSVEQDIFIQRNAHSSDATIDKFVNPEYIIQRLSGLYPITPENIVNTSQEFDLNSENQLIQMNGLESTVYSLIMNEKTYQTVQKYTWSVRDKRFMNKIYQSKGVDATNVSNEAISLFDGIYIYINRYSFKRRPRP